MLESLRVGMVYSLSQNYSTRFSAQFITEERHRFVCFSLHHALNASMNQRASDRLRHERIRNQWIVHGRVPLPKSIGGSLRIEA